MVGKGLRVDQIEPFLCKTLLGKFVGEVFGNGQFELLDPTPMMFFLRVWSNVSFARKKMDRIHFS